MSSDQMNVINPIILKKRLHELLIDYLVIVGYLVALAVVVVSFYFLVLGDVPQVSPWQSQLIAVLTSVVPVVIWFSMLDYRGGSIGKRRAGLKLHYKTHTWWRATLRNIVKFLPWQLAHMGVIAGVYSDFETIDSLILTIAGTLLFLIMMAQGLLTKSKRHLGDYIAGTQVTERQIPKIISKINKKCAILG